MKFPGIKQYCSPKPVLECHLTVIVRIVLNKWLSSSDKASAHFCAPVRDWLDVAYSTFEADVGLPFYGRHNRQISYLCIFFPVRQSQRFDASRSRDYTNGL
ncbi:hypothetical protein TNCV_3094251 [Trichonephila clavipes]|nr:hypothetical protein TNCV_3094251 [Trichonephila clavipes]